MDSCLCVCEKFELFTNFQNWRWKKKTGKSWAWRKLRYTHILGMYSWREWRNPDTNFISKDAKVPGIRQSAKMEQHIEHYWHQNNHHRASNWKCIHILSLADGLFKRWMNNFGGLYKMQLGFSTQLHDTRSLYFEERERHDLLTCIRKNTLVSRSWSCL